MELKSISYFYGNNQALKDINLDIKKGEILSILGANGSGKSTLLKAMVGLIDYGGEIFIQGVEARKISVRQKAKLIAYVPQDSSIVFDYSVLDIVLMGRFHANLFGFKHKKEDIDIAQESLCKVGIESCKHKAFKELSGGQKQLVLLARALAQQSQIIILDEPVSGLDLGRQMGFLELLEELSELGKSIIQTTHYPDHALKISDRVAWLSDGVLIGYGDSQEVITRERIEQIYNINSQFIACNEKLFVLPLKFIKKEKR